MKSIPLAAIAALLLSPAVLADRFYLGSPEAAEKMVEGSSPDVIHGVLVDETDATYTIRVVGGEIVLPKAKVYRIEKDDLSIADILAREKALANRAARSLRAESAPAETPSGGVFVEVEEHEGDHHPSRHGHAHAVHAHGHAGFDPVIGAALHGHDLALRIVKLQYLYEATGDRRYIKLVRRLRRAR